MVHPVPKSSPRVRCSCKTTEGLVALANFDADKEKELPEKYEVPGYPTFYLFVDGLFGMENLAPTGWVSAFTSVW